MGSSAAGSRNWGSYSALKVSERFIRALAAMVKWRFLGPMTKVTRSGSGSSSLDEILAVVSQR